MIAYDIYNSDENLEIEFCVEFEAFKCIIDLLLPPLESSNYTFEIDLQNTLITKEVVYFNEFTLVYEAGSMRCHDTMKYEYEVLVNGVENSDYIVDSENRTITIQTDSIAQFMVEEEKKEICNTIQINAVATTFEGFSLGSEAPIFQEHCWKLKENLEPYGN